MNFIFKSISILFTVLLILPALLFSNETIYNISLSPVQPKNKVNIELSTGWGSRYAPTKWSVGREFWLGSTYGITDNLFVKASGGYNINNGDGGFKFDVGYKIYTKNNLNVGIAGTALRETTGVYDAGINIIVSKSINKINLISNNYFEKAFAANRDEVDWNFTFGTSYNLGLFDIGIEYIGEDLEDMWEDEESEGGANNMFAILLAVNNDKYGFSVTPGYSVGPRPQTANSFIVLSKFWITL